MTGTYTLLLVALTSAMFAVTMIRRRIVSWSVVSSAFVVASVAGYLVAPDRAWPWIAVPFVLLMVVPLVLTRQVAIALAGRRYRAGLRLAQIAQVFHPSRRQRGWVHVTRGWALLSEGKLEDAEAEIGRARDLERDAIELELLRVRQRWHDIAARLADRSLLTLEGGYGVLKVRALGEIGDLANMLELYRLLESEWSKDSVHEEDLATLRLFVASFLGRRDLVELVCTGPLRHYSPAIRQFWEATALASAGDLAAATAIWQELARDPDWRMRSGAEHRLAHPPALAHNLGAEQLDALAVGLRDAATYAGGGTNGGAPARMAQVFGGLLVAIHIATELEPRIVFEGVFYSPAVLIGGEWWRVVTAVFLHAGWLHLALNVFALLLFGPFVERYLGRARFAILAVLGGVAGFLVLTVLAGTGLRGPQAALGASGGVMALIGATTAIYLRGSLERSPTARARLRGMLAFVAVQTLFDLIAPNVSMTGHLTGLVVGFAVGLVRRPRA